MSSLFTYDSSTHYTTMPHNLIIGRLSELIKQTFIRYSSVHLACNEKRAFVTSEQPKIYTLWSC